MSIPASAIHCGAVGLGVDARGMNNRLNTVFPGKYPEVPEGGAVWVFALK
jgi:alcohol dehydrogenase (cytochrome c)